MSLSVIPLTILGQITGVSGSGETAMYKVSFKSIDGTPLYGVTAVWTDEQAEIEALAAQKPYGVWINPIDGTFTVKFAGYTYVGSADLTDSDVLAGITPIEFANQSGGGSGLPDVTEDDEGKQLTVVNGEWSKNGYIYETIDRRDTSVSPNKTYVVHFHRQGNLVRVNCNAIPMSLFTDIVIPQGYRPANEYDGVRQLILNVDDNSVEWAQFDDSTKKFNYFGSSTGKFLIDFTYFTYNAFPTE